MPDHLICPSMEADVFAASDTPKPGGEKAKSKHSKLKNDMLIKGLQEIEGKLNKLIEENKKLKKDYANEQCRGNQERAKKLEEENRRQQLEKENHNLKAEISSYKKNDHVKDENEIQLLKDRLLEAEGELERLKKLHSVEKMKLENESKKVISDKMKAVEALKSVKNEKNKVEDDKKFIKKKSEEYMRCLEKARFEIKELTEKLKSETSKTEDFKKKFESEKLKMVEKVRADLHQTFTAEQKRSIDIERKKTNEEKARVEHLTRVLVEEKQIREKLQKKIEELTEKLKSETSKTEDFKKKFESKKLKMVEKVRADLHKTFTAEQKRSIDIERKKTNEEKTRVEHLTRVLVEEKQIREKLQKKIEDFESTSKRKRGNCNAKKMHVSDSSVTNENTVLLREMCKLLKKQAKHAEKKATPEKIYIVQEPQFVQQSLMDLSNRVNLLDACLAHSIEGIDVPTETRVPQGANGVKKKNNLLDNNMTKHQSKKERRVTKICCSGNAPISELASTEPHKGINNPQTSAICSNTSYSDIRSMGSKEKNPLAALPSTNIKFKRPNKRPASINLSIATPKIAEIKKTCILANNVEECRSYKEHVCSSKRQKLQDSRTGEKTSAIENDNPQQDKRNIQMNEPHFSRSELDDLITFEKIIGGNCLKLLDIDSSTEEKYRKAVEMPISPTLPCLEVPKHQLQVEGDTRCVMEKDGPLMNNFKSNTSSVVTKHNETLEAVNTTFVFADNAPITRKLHTGGQNMAPIGITLQGDIHVPSNISKPPTLCCIVHSDIKDKDNISRIICMRNTFTCQNITTVSQLDRLVVQVHNVIARNATFTHQEKGSVLLSLLVCNISSRISVDLKSTPSKDLLPSFKTSVAEINNVIFSADTKALLEEICHLDVLTSLLEDFLIEKRSLVYCDKLYESIDTSSIVSQLDGTHILSKPATFDQFIAGCIILASISGAANRVGFLLQTSYKILRMCRTEDASWVLSALHIFASVNGNNCVAADEHKFLIVALNSMVRLIESTRVPATDFSYLSHFKECPFATSALCMEKLATLLLDALQCFIGCGVKDNNVQNSNYFSVSMVHDGENDVSSGSDLLFTYIKHDDDDISSGFLESAYCHINDVISLLELVGCYMSLEWTCNNILPCILKILESCRTEEYSIVLLNLIGQLGRFGVEANGYKSNRLPKLRDAISMFLNSTNTKKYSLRNQFAAVNSLLNLLPFTLKEIIDKHQNFHPDAELSNYAEAIASWFSGLTDRKQSLCLDFLNQVNVASR